MSHTVAQANWGRGWQIALESDFPDEYSLSTFVGAGFGKLNRLLAQVRETERKQQPHTHYTPPHIYYKPLIYIYIEIYSIYIGRYTLCVCVVAVGKQ